MCVCVGHSPFGCCQLHFNGFISLHHSHKNLRERLAVHQHWKSHNHTPAWANGKKKKKRREKKFEKCVCVWEAHTEVTLSPFTSVMETWGFSYARTEKHFNACIRTCRRRRRPMRALLYYAVCVCVWSHARYLIGRWREQWRDVLDCTIAEQNCLMLRGLIKRR